MKIMNYKPVVAKSGDYQHEKAKILKNYIESNHFETCDNNLIALYGGWGSGKSTVFKTLEEILDEKKFKTITFESWKYEKDQNLPLSLYEFILDNIIGDKEALMKIIKEGIGDGLKSFFKGVSVNLGAVNIDGSKIELIEKEESAYTKTSNFLEKCDEEIKKHVGDKKLIVLIDDLDRCDDENILTFISALKLMFSLSNVIFVCGLDKEAIEKILENKYGKSEKSKTYLDKIFPVNFTLFDMAFNLSEYDLDFSELKQVILKNMGIDNARKITTGYNKYLSLIELANDNDEVKKRIKRIVLFIIIICYESLGNKTIIQEFENNENYINLRTKPNKLIAGADSTRIGIIQEKIIENLSAENPYLGVNGILTLISVMNSYKVELIKKIHIKM